MSQIFALKADLTDNKPMDKRIFLNVMIVALLTFYMIFNIVYNQLMEKHEPEQEQETINDVWAGDYIVPESWKLTRLEMPSTTLQVDENSNWSESRGAIDPLAATAIALSWQNLKATEINSYQQLPLNGDTLLAFVAEDSQPLVFRLIEDGENLHFYRMIDQKRFSFPLESKLRLIVLPKINP